MIIEHVLATRYLANPPIAPPKGTIRMFNTLTEKYYTWNIITEKYYTLEEWEEEFGEG